VIVDPSHGIGIREHVPAMAKAAVAAGADGLIIEVHPKPEEALSDGPQSLLPDQFDKLMKELKILASALGRDI
jgi:3-deoxy-7-phosphoheptulonate synthase